MPLDRENILRNADLRGHQLEGMVCKRCGITFDEMLKLQVIPPCDPSRNKPDIEPVNDSR